MGDLVQFVDSIASSPTVRLDMNTETNWYVAAFSAPAPRLRRSVSSNAMRDGVYVSSSSYDSRVVTMTLESLNTTQDLSATELQKLARELDRPNNILKYQPNTLTKPVFFRTYRSDMAQIEDVLGAKAFRRYTIELLAEPFAVGLRETVAVGTVTNNPASGSQGCYFDVSTIIGDVPTPAMILQSSFTESGTILAVRQRRTPSDLTWFKQAESCTLGTNTTNPGGGPDAAMSGTGTNNFVRTSFGTAAMGDRISWNVGADHATAAKNLALAGTYRLFVAVRRSDMSSVIQLRWSKGLGGGVGSTVVTNNLTTARQMVDLGLVSFDSSARKAGYGPDIGVTTNSYLLSIQAERVSGAGTLDWDAIFLVPADECMHIQTRNTFLGAGADGLLIDSITQDAVFTLGDPFATGSVVTMPPVEVSGGWPRLIPGGQVNRVYVFQSDEESLIGSTTSISLSYWPLYLFVRPSTT